MYKEVPGGLVEVLDLDKTIAHTRHLQRLLEALVELHDIDSDRMRAARQATTGFDTVKYLREEAGADDEAIADIHSDFVSQVAIHGREQFFMPGAERLLKLIDHSGRIALILTTGGGEWQYWKLQALDLDKRLFHITSGREKSLLLARCFSPVRNRYEFEEVQNLPGERMGLAFTNFRIVDDNEQAFIGLPADAIGLQVNNTDEEWQRSTRSPLYLPNVTPILHLDPYIEQLESEVI